MGGVLGAAQGVGAGVGAHKGHPRAPTHTNHWALRTRKRHRQEHRPQRPTERSDPTQHAEGRTGDCPGPHKGTTTRRNVTQTHRTREPHQEGQGRAQQTGRRGTARQERQPEQREQGTRMERMAERARGRQQQQRGWPGQPGPSLPGARATPAQPASGGGCLLQPRWAVCGTGVGAHQGQTSREGEQDIWWTAGTARGGTGHLGLTHTQTQRGRLRTACGQRRVDSKNSQTTPATTSTSSIRQLLGTADAQTAHHCHIQHSPGTPSTGLRERGNDTSKSTGRSGRQKAATRHNMRREERVTVQGPAKEQQPDGMSHRGTAWHHRRGGSPPPP